MGWPSTAATRRRACCQTFPRRTRRRRAPTRHATTIGAFAVQ
jgi:hypothetical protein